MINETPNIENSLNQSLMKLNQDRISNMNLNSKKGANLSDGDKEQLAKAARGFEAIFLNMMIKEMKSAQLDDENESEMTFGSDTLMGYTDMLYADQISNNGNGLGLAEQIYQEMTGEKLPFKTVINPTSERESKISADLNLPKGIGNIEQNKLNGSFLERVKSRIDNYSDIIEDASNKFDVPQDLIKAVITAESAGKYDAKSSAGAKGLMQLMDGTASDLGVKNSFNPADNIMGGAKYLRMMLDKYNGNLSHALAAYNAGPGNVDKYSGIPPFKETIGYVSKVLKYKDFFENDLE